MFEFWHRLLASDAYAPHGICLLWQPELIWTHAISDVLIAAAYFSIPLAMAAFLAKRPDVPFNWVAWCFVAFITACGVTHMFGAWTLWNPDYGAEAVVKLMTAAISVATAIALWPFLPVAIAIPSPEQLRRANRVLQDHLDERDAALAALRRETEERLRTEAMLRQAQKMEVVGQLTGGIAHDFNNLLTVIVGSLERIERRLDPSAMDLHRAVQNALTCSQRASDLTHQLLAFARKQTLEPTELDANILVARTAGLVGNVVGAQIAIEQDLAENLWPIQADRNQLENALINLVVNARDAMPQGGVIRITTRNARQIPDAARTAMAAEGGWANGAGWDGPWVSITVADTGIGMAADVRERAFEPFFTTKPAGSGSGLGLSQVHGFLRQSSGAVLIESEPNQGTTVTLYFPRYQPAQVDSPARRAMDGCVQDNAEGKGVARAP